MPNHVSNHIEAPKEVLDEILSKDESGRVVFDFNVLIPMPDYVYRGNIGMAEMVLYGENNSLDWSRKYWGTKWNAYSVDRISDSILTFETAWSHPAPVIEALSKKFSNESIFVAYADEDSGHNLGVYVIQNGEILEEGMVNKGSFEAMKMASLLTDFDRIQIVRDEIIELKKNWDQYKDYPGVDDELAGYKNEIESYEMEIEFAKVDKPNFDFDNLKSYLEL